MPSDTRPSHLNKYFYVQVTTALGEMLATKQPEVVSTEYRNQFAWPKDATDSIPRKSISMGALKKAAVAEGNIHRQFDYGADLYLYPAGIVH